MSKTVQSASEASTQARPVYGPAWRKAEEQGLDMSLIEENLAKTPWERMQDHAGALRLVETLQEAGRRLHGGS